MLMLMIVIMLVIVRIGNFRLLLGSLICLCHLSRGQVLAFQETSVSAAPHAMRYERGYASFTTVRVFGREGQTSRRPLTPVRAPDHDQNLHSSLY